MDDQLRIPINASVRHVHLSREHVTALFGEAYELTRKADLSQPGQYACEESISLVGPKRSLHRVRVLGPPRSKTQVEISRTDEIHLGIDAPIRPSGATENTPSLILEGPQGKVTLDGKGVIQAQRHIHMHPDDAARFEVEDKDWVMVRVPGKRGLIYDDVLIRISEKYALDMHLDTDEANAADLHPGAYGVLIKEPTTVKPEPDD